MAVNATKSLIGHGLGAAAGLEAIACIMAIKTGKLHPSLNQDVRSTHLPVSPLVLLGVPWHAMLGDATNCRNGSSIPALPMH